MSLEKLCLRWNDFETNISLAFRELRESEDFFDVTLACEDNHVQAHKVILSACSPFFRNILRRNPHQHPLIYLKGIKCQELQSILDFMYMGEVKVAQDDLNSFITVAEDLRVKGLTENSSSGTANKNPFEAVHTVTEPFEEVDITCPVRIQPNTNTEKYLSKYHNKATSEQRARKSNGHLNKTKQKREEPFHQENEPMRNELLKHKVKIIKQKNTENVEGKSDTSRVNPLIKLKVELDLDQDHIVDIFDHNQCERDWFQEENIGDIIQNLAPQVQDDVENRGTRNLAITSQKPDMLVQYFKNAWQCGVCEKVCSSRKTTLTHLKEVHRIKQDGKTITKANSHLAVPSQKYEQPVITKNQYELCKGKPSFQNTIEETTKIETHNSVSDQNYHLHNDHLSEVNLCTEQKLKDIYITVDRTQKSETLVKYHNNVWHCGICSKVCSSRRRTYIHLRDVHSIEKDSLAADNEMEDEVKDKEKSQMNQQHIQYQRSDVDIFLDMGEQGEEMKQHDKQHSTKLLKDEQLQSKNMVIPLEDKSSVYGTRNLAITCQKPGALVQYFKNAWQCGICSKVCSSRKTTITHLKEVHNITTLK